MPLKGLARGFASVLLGYSNTIIFQCPPSTQSDDKLYHRVLSWTKCWCEMVHRFPQIRLQPDMQPRGDLPRSRVFPFIQTLHSLLRHSWHFLFVIELYLYCTAHLVGQIYPASRTKCSWSIASLMEVYQLQHAPPLGFPIHPISQPIPSSYFSKFHFEPYHFDIN